MAKIAIESEKITLMDRRYFKLKSEKFGIAS